MESTIHFWRFIHRFLVFAFAFGFALYYGALAAQPSLSVRLQSDKCQNAAPCRFIVEARWLGAPERYAFYPPELDLEEGFEPGGVEQRYVQLDEETVYTWLYTLKPSSTGVHSPGKIHLVWRDMEQTGASDERKDGRERTLELPEISVVTGGFRAHIAGGILLFLVFLSMVFFLRRRSIKPKGRASLRETGKAEIKASDLFEDARSALQNTDVDRFMTCILRIKALLPKENDPLPSSRALEDERLRLKYGGASPNLTRLEAWLKDAERVLAPKQV